MKGKKKLMIEALKHQLGNVTLACKEVGITRDTHYRWIKEDIEYKEETVNLDDFVIDYVENALFKKINKGDTACILFYLKCKAKHRGYIERTEQSHIHSGDVKINFIDPYICKDSNLSNGRTDSSEAEQDIEYLPAADEAEKLKHRL